MTVLKVFELYYVLQVVGVLELFEVLDCFGSYSSGKPLLIHCSSDVMLSSASQNDYDELHALLEWAVPGGLGDRHHFQEYYEGPIKMAQKKDIDDSALGRVSRLNHSTDMFVKLKSPSSAVISLLFACKVA